MSKIQSFYRILYFKAIKTKPNIINKNFLKNIIDIFLKIALLLCSLIFNIKLTSYFLLFIFDLYFINIKIIIVLVILCQLVYQNNDKSFLIFIILYIYFTSIKFNTITLFNFFNLFILYKIL